MKKGYYLAAEHPSPDWSICLSSFFFCKRKIASAESGKQLLKK